MFTLCKKSYYTNICSVFTGSSPPVWLDNLGCTSSAVGNDNLRRCSHFGTGLRHVACDHSNDIVLSCLAGECTLLYTILSRNLVWGSGSEILFVHSHEESYLVEPPNHARKLSSPQRFVLVLQRVTSFMRGSLILEGPLSKVLLLSLLQ